MTQPVPLREPTVYCRSMMKEAFHYMVKSDTDFTSKITSCQISKV